MPRETNDATIPFQAKERREEIDELERLRDALKNTIDLVFAEYRPVDSEEGAAVVGRVRESVRGLSEGFGPSEAENSGFRRRSVSKGVDSLDLGGKLLYYDKRNRYDVVMESIDPSGGRPSDDVESDWDVRLRKAYLIRELLDAVLWNDWLGLELLCEVAHLPGISISQLAANTAKSVDEIAPALVHLTKVHALSADRQGLCATEIGVATIRRLSETTNIDLVGDVFGG